MFRSSSRTSAKTGVAPEWTMTFAVAGHVIGVVITSSPGPTPSATSARCIAAVPDATASTCSASSTSAARRSSSADFGPVVSQPDRSVSATASISSSPIAGGWKPSFVVRLGRDLGVDMGRQEAYELCRLLGAPQRMLGGTADGENRAGAVGATPQRREHVARATVDANAAHALERKRLVEPAHLLQLALGRDEEANACAADARLRREQMPADRLAQRSGERDVVEVDAECRAAEL